MEIIACCMKNNGCNGTLDLNRGFNIKTGCISHTMVFPCKVCGRVASIRQNIACGTQTRSGEDVYLENDTLVSRD